MKNITVLVSGGGTNLQALIDAMKDSKIKNGKINYVISSNPNAYALKRAEENGIQTVVVNRKTFTSSKEFNDELKSTLLAQNPDLIVMAGFMCIVSDEIIQLFENKIINIHPSLIPAFCGDGFYGLKVHEAALNKGVKVTGATVHFVNEITDGGAIILQKAIDIKSTDTAQTLQKRVMEQVEWELLPKAVDLFCNDQLMVFNNKVIIKE